MDVCLTHGNQDQILEVFVLSEAGKPIYSYNRREDLITLLPLCQALVNYFSDTQNDSLRYILTKSGLRISFSVKSPLILVVVTHSLSGIDANLVVNQIQSQIISTITGKTLKSVFEQRPTFDLRRLLTGSEKMLDLLIEDGFLNKPMVGSCHSINSSEISPYSIKCYLSSVLNPMANNPRSSNSFASSANLSHLKYFKSHLNQVMVPVSLLSSSIRDSITNVVTSSVSSNSSCILFSLLFEVESLVKPEEKDESSKHTSSTKLVTICNHNGKVSKLNPLDVQLIQVLIVASENQLNSVESFWIPICLPRFNSAAFLHAHISYLNANLADSSKNLCLVLLTTSRDDFHKCQLARDAVRERLNKITLTEPQLSELSIPYLQIFWYQSLRPQSIFWRALPHLQVTRFSCLVHLMASRMLNSKLKTMWIRSDLHKITVLGWHSPTFQLYCQFDVTITQSHCLTAAQAIIKWIKNEESKFILKDYQ